jgi:hypothetical protein
MGKLESIRAKLDKKLFNLGVLGSDILVTPITQIEGSASYGGYTDTTFTEGTPVETIGVPYNKTKFNLSYVSFGNLEADEIVMVLRYDVAVDKDYKITYDSQSWRVKEYRDIPLNNGIVAKIVKLKKVY